MVVGLGSVPQERRIFRPSPVVPPMTEDIPWHVYFRARLLWLFYRGARRGFWVRYWESQGINEEQQMRWAAEADEEEGHDV
jgi:hypothetical protein